jgi:hypothetical protein
LRQTWITNVNDSNDAIAKAIASTVQSSFQSRMNAVKEQAAAAELIELLQKSPAPEDPQARALLTRIYKEKKGSTPHRPWFARWTLARADASLVDNYGWSPDGTVGPGGGTDDAYHWRGWFNGQEDRPAAEREQSRAGDLARFRERRRTQALISQPYHRQGTDTPVISITCPIASADNTEPLGVLSGQVYYPHFLNTVSEFVASESDRKRNIVIVNDRQQVIYSTKLAQAADDGDRARFVIEKHDSDLYRQALAGSFPSQPYTSELDGQEYLGASRLINLKNGQTFAVIVQQESSQALAGLGAIQGLAIGTIVALIGVGGLCLVINVLALRREAVHA